MGQERCGWTARDGSLARTAIRRGCRSCRAVAQSTVGWCVAGSESWTEIDPDFALSPRRNRFERLLLAYANHLSVFKSFMLPLVVRSAVAALNSAVQM